MEFKFIPVDYDYFDFEGKNYVRMIGRNDKGKRVCVVDSYEPNFWVILKEGFEGKAEEVASKISKVEVEKAGRKTRVLKTEIEQKKFLGKDVTAIRVYVTNHKDAHDIASEMGDMKEIECRREYDIPLITKYIKEKNVLPLHWYTVKGDLLSVEDFGGLFRSLELEICVKLEEVKDEKKELGFEPRILAYDIETDNGELGKGDILMISLSGKGFRKVLTWKGVEGSQDYVENFEDEASMIEGFVKYVKEYDPDILTGYFCDGFDLPYIKHNSMKNKIKLSLGLDESEPSFRRGRIPTGKISGIVHLDVYRFISAVFSQYLQSETLSLNEVAKELVGEEKEDFDFARLASMEKEDWIDFFSYNMQDANVTLKLVEKIWPDILEFTRIVKEPLFDVTRDRMSSHVENYLIHNLDSFNEIIEKRPLNDEIGKRRARAKYEGAFVLEPKPGLYKNVVMFDFTSFWPSIIVSYNLSKSTFLEKKEKDSIEVDLGKKKVYFSKEEGFFPEMLMGVIKLRKKYKKEYGQNKSNLLKARSNAYKLLANASYGYQGFFGARYYCPEASASATAISRDFIHKTIEKIEGEGHKALYSDTDSIAFLQGDKSKAQVLKMLKEINEDLPGIMELDLEDFYTRGIFVLKRGGVGGAKKKYALISEKGELKIRGFETVRRDWCKLARNLQSEVLDFVLKDGDEKRALSKLKKIVKNLKERKVDLKDLIIKTQLRRPLNEYLSEGPHVAAAKKMEELGISVTTGMLVEYFVGEKCGKGKRISDRVCLPEEKSDYDIDYYLNNQVLPAVENIFEVFGISVKEIMSGESQKKLF